MKRVLQTQIFSSELIYQSLDGATAMLNAKPPFNLDGDLPSINWIKTIGQLP